MVAIDHCVQFCFTVTGRRYFMHAIFRDLFMGMFEVEQWRTGLCKCLQNPFGVSSWILRVKLDQVHSVQLAQSRQRVDIIFFKQF